MEKARETEKKVFSYIEEHHMLRGHDRVVVGVSGGADSVCLLFVLLQYAGEHEIKLAVAHVNHGLRPEAGQDAEFVRRLCGERGLPFYLTNADVRETAVEEGCSEEEAGRRIRYQAFAEAAADFGADKIAVAHNANDRAETMLFHLFRGSDLRGLGSIRPVRDNIIRPLLGLERAEIEAYLLGRGIPYCQDVTNAGDAYTRNRIRHHILPYAEREIAPGCVSHIARTAGVLDETEQYLEQQTAEAAGKVGMLTGAEPFGTYLVDTERFGRLHPVIQRRVLYRFIGEISGSVRDITHIHVEAVRELALREGNRWICLPCGVRAERSYGQVLLKRDGGAEEETTGLSVYPVYRQGSCEELLGCSAEEFLRWMQSGQNTEVLQNQYTKCFDCDKIEQSTLVLRTRRTGDYLTLAGGGGAIIRKSLKEYMITEKIPRGERDRLPVLATGSHVLWLAGYRISEQAKINANTKQVLQVQLKQEQRSPETMGNQRETEDKNVGTCEGTLDRDRG